MSDITAFDRPPALSGPVELELDAGRARAIVHPVRSLSGGALRKVDVSIAFVGRDEDGTWYWSRVALLSVDNLATRRTADAVVRGALLSVLPVGRYDVTGPRSPATSRRKSRAEAVDVAARVVADLLEKP